MFFTCQLSCGIWLSVLFLYFPNRISRTLKPGSCEGWTKFQKDKKQKGKVLPQWPALALTAVLILVPTAVVKLLGQKCRIPKFNKAKLKFKSEITIVGEYKYER